MTRLRAGIVGMGMIGPVHAQAVVRAGAELVAVTSGGPESTRRAADAWGAEAIPTAEELIAHPSVDVVHLCLPNVFHGPLAHLALAAGKHVICEKPLAVDVDQAEALAAAAAAADVVHAVPFVYRYHAMASEARARVAAGELGAVRLVHGSYLQDWLASQQDSNWRVHPATGGTSRAFADIGAHWCDLVEWITGHRIVELCASTSVVHPERPGSRSQPEPVETEDAVSLVFRTDHGALGNLVVSQVSWGRKNRLWFEIDGTGATAVFDQEQPDQLWIGSARGFSVVPRDPKALSPEATRLAVVPAGHPQGYLDAFAAFVHDVYAAIAGQEVPAFPTFVDGARANRLIHAVLRSAEKRSWCEVPS